MLGALGRLREMLGDFFEIDFESIALVDVEVLGNRYFAQPWIDLQGHRCCGLALKDEEPASRPTRVACALMFKHFPQV